MNHHDALPFAVTRWFPSPRLVTVCLLLLGSGAARAQPALVAGPRPKAPPPAPPIRFSNGNSKPAEHYPLPKGLTPYSIGQPTGEEQLYLEFLNRMRANPTAEGARLATTTDPSVLSAYASFGVDTNLLQSEFSTNPPVPPVAMNAQLTASARWHSGDMFTNMYQGHYQTNGAIVMDPGDRIHTNGYAWTTYGENVYAYAESVFYGHAGFAVDWGPGIGGMQTPPGHRNNMLSGGFREVGIGVVDGVNGPVGPQLVTQDFGTQFSASPLITGVVYYDLNGNGFYDVGEGIGGVTVNCPGSKYYAVTADSGGYAIPVSSNGNYTLTFSASGLSTQLVATVAGQNNVKVDYLPVYTPPVISGPNPAILGQSNVYTFSGVGAATGYQWQQTLLAPYTYIEGAENGLTNVTVMISPGYPIIISDLVASGSHAFHLAQPDTAGQYLTLDPVLRPGAGSALSFAKRLGWASPTQVAKAQVSSDGGASWEDVWTQAGNNSSGDAAYSTVTVPLAAYVGENIQIRFAYEFEGGSFFNQVSTGVGFYLDNIAVSNAKQLLNPITTDLGTNTAFVLDPAGMSAELVQVRAEMGSRFLNWGPALTLTVAAPSPTLQVVTAPVVAGNQVQIDFAVGDYQNGMLLQLWTATDPTGPWTQDASAALQTLVPNTKFRFTSATGGAAKRFYRVKGVY